MYTLESALQQVSKGAHTGEDDFLLACEYLIDHRNELTHRVFIDIPDPHGMLTTNTDTKWDKIRAGSVARCACGNERIIMPIKMRSEFIAIIGEPTVLTESQELFIKPLGGDKQSAYLHLSVERRAKGVCALLYRNPFDHVFNFNDLFDGPPTILLTTIIEDAREDGELVLFFAESDLTIPILKIVAATETSLSVRLDTGVEAFDPKTEQIRHQH